MDLTSFLMLNVLETKAKIFQFDFLQNNHYFSSNVVIIMVTKSEFLATKDEILVALVTILVTILSTMVLHCISK